MLYSTGAPARKFLQAVAGIFGKTRSDSDETHRRIKDLAAWSVRFRGCILRACAGI